MNCTQVCPPVPVPTQVPVSLLDTNDTTQERRLHHTGQGFETGFCLFFKLKPLFPYHTEWWLGEGGGVKKTRFQSQEDQELSTSSHQLILKMISEDQTVYHTNMVMNDHESRHDLCLITHIIHHTKTQTLKIVLKGPISVHRPPPRHMYLCSHELWSRQSYDNISCPTVYHF